MISNDLLISIFDNDFKSSGKGTICARTFLYYNDKGFYLEQNKKDCLWCVRQNKKILVKGLLDEESALNWVKIFFKKKKLKNNLNK